MPKKGRNFFNFWENLYIEGDILKKKTISNSQIVLPRSFQNIVYEELHVKMGYLGADRVIDLAKRFYWPGKDKNIRNYVSQRCECLKRKNANIPEGAPLVDIVSTEPF